MRLDPLPALSDNYIWLLADANGHALVVDPGEAEPVETAIARDGLQLKAILLTHHHADHVAGAESLRARHDAVIYGPDDDRIKTIDMRVGDGDVVELDAPRVCFQVWAVPGHTRTHIAFVGEEWLFCGDTLFSLGCGRLFEGTPQQMLQSLDRLSTLPDSTQVCCGHEYTLANAAFAHGIEPDNAALAQRTEQARQSTHAGRASLPSRMDEERAANPFLRVDSAAVKQWVDTHAPQAANDRVERFAALRAAKDGFHT
ncbi:MAG TPA: hydroxyacylglutathione hydrolase [Rhodanobacteraceae bacterium]|nr:hydroxyacylglutathione hydrolase [Rhodanobacteraceae bacterium]